MMDSPDQEEYLLFSWLHNNYGKHNRFCMRSYRFGNISHVMFCCQRKNVVSHQDQIWLFSSKTISLSVYLEKKEEERDNTVLCFFGFFFLGCVGSSSLCGLSLVAASGGYSSLWCVGFSLPCLLCCGTQALGTWASVVTARGLGSCGMWALERAGFSSCGTQAQQLWCTGLVAPRHVGSSQTRDRTHVRCIGRRILNHCATTEV